MSAAEIVKLIVLLMVMLMCLFPNIDASVTDSTCASCRDGGVQPEHCNRCKRFCTPLMNGCYYKRDGSKRITDNQRFPEVMLDRLAEEVTGQNHHMNTLNKRSHRSLTQTHIAKERCAVENLITSLPENWQQDILEVVRWAILANKAGSLPTQSANLADYLVNYIELEQSNL